MCPGGEAEGGEWQESGTGSGGVESGKTVE